jgi:hypothetical protein
MRPIDLGAASLSIILQTAQLSIDDKSVDLAQTLQYKGSPAECFRRLPPLKEEIGDERPSS